MGVYQKEQGLGKILAELGSMAVCFSGGVDSTFLLAKAVSYGTGKVVAVLIKSESMTSTELHAAQENAQQLGLEPVVIEVKELNEPKLAANPPDRCYYCKQLSYGEIIRFAKQQGIEHILDGTNADDLADYRPGLKAKQEAGVLSPLAKVGLSKAEIRTLSQQIDLPTWDKPSSPCLNSRVPYGEPITLQKLDQIAQAEAFLRELGFKELRVRHHSGLARIEVVPAQIAAVLAQATVIEETLKTYGFTWVSVDLGGFRTGSLNQGLNVES